MDNSPQQLYAQGGYQFAVSDPNNGIRRDGVKGDFGLKLLGRVVSNSLYSFAAVRLSAFGTKRTY